MYVCMYVCLFVLLWLFDTHHTHTPGLFLVPPIPPIYLTFLPLSLSLSPCRCLTCGNYVYKGKKFNARKEDAVGEKYLGIQIYRFYIRCPECLSEITFKVSEFFFPFVRFEPRSV